MDKALKQRLVGASVLIILAVIVLPMLLSGRSDRLKQESRRIELPPKPDELSIETRRFPVGAPTRPASTAVQETLENKEPLNTVQPQIDSESETGSIETPAIVLQESGNDENPPPASDLDNQEIIGSESIDIRTPGEVGPGNDVVESDVVTPIASTVEADKPLEILQEEETSEGAPRYLVQVASFSNEKNASVLSDLLKAENLAVLMDVVDRPAGRMYRVRVGPYSQRYEADALVASLRAKMTDLTPRVLDLRPDESAPVSTPSDPLVRWVVQVGSFSSSKSAQDLVTELRLAGLSAYSEKVTSAAGTVHKVRIGPELDRDKAVDLARRVKAEHHLETFVTTEE